MVRYIITKAGRIAERQWWVKSPKDLGQITQLSYFPQLGDKALCFVLGFKFR